MKIIPLTRQRFALFNNDENIVLSRHDIISILEFLNWLYLCDIGGRYPVRNCIAIQNFEHTIEIEFKTASSSRIVDRKIQIAKSELPELSAILIDWTKWQESIGSCYFPEAS